MRFVQGAEVITATGEKIGALDRVVLDPQTKEVSHLIIRKGGMFTAHKIVPVDLVETTVGKQIQLKETDQELADFLDFQEEHFIRLEQADPDEVHLSVDSALISRLPDYE